MRVCDCEVSGVYARLSIRIGFNDTRNVCTILMFIGKGRGTQATLYTFYIQTDGWNIFRIVSLCVRARSLYGFVLALSDKVFCFGRFALLLAGWLLVLLYGARCTSPFFAGFFFVVVVVISQASKRRV